MQAPFDAPLDDTTEYSLEQLERMVEVLDVIRSGRTRTRQEVGNSTGLGRTAVTNRLTELIKRGLVVEAGLGPSAGGRSPRELRFRSEAGIVLAADLGATSITVGATDLAGSLLTSHEAPWDISTGPDASLDQVETMFEETLSSPAVESQPSWGAGIALPGPVEFATGRPISPPIMPGWDGYNVRGRLGRRYDVPVWVDNDVNMMALGELRSGCAQGVGDMIFIKIGTGIGAGLISGHRLHRGAQGCAGDFGHVAVVGQESVVCRCGKLGCLEALAGGAAIAQQGRAAAESGRSDHLAEVLATKSRIEAADVGKGAERGDSTCVDILTTAGLQIGRALATLVSVYNPAVLVLGGGVTSSGDRLLAAIRQCIYERSLPLATRDLQIMLSALPGRSGIIGAARMVIDQLFRPEILGRWLLGGSPAGHPELPDLHPAA